MRAKLSKVTNIKMNVLSVSGDVLTLNPKLKPKP